MEQIIEVVACLLWRQNGERREFLIAQRPAHKARGLLWEFVGGKVEPGETRSEALIRECREELDVKVGVGAQFMQVLHPYPDMTVRLTIFHATLDEGVPKLLEHLQIAWITPDEISQYEFCPADRDILMKIQEEAGLTAKKLEISEK